MPFDPGLARRTHRTLEPFHGMIYFVGDAADAYAAVGVTGRSGYFASRSAPMGAVAADVVIATFFNFHPGLVRHAMDGVWSVVTPAALLTARLAGADAALRRLVPEAVGSPEVKEAAALAREAAMVACEHLEGRALFAGHAALPTGPRTITSCCGTRLTLLREFRGDGHIAAMTVEGLTACEALVIHGATGEVPPAILKTSRAWPDDEWAAAEDSVRGAGVARPPTARERRRSRPPAVGRRPHRRAGGSGRGPLSARTPAPGFASWSARGAAPSSAVASSASETTERWDSGSRCTSFFAVGDWWAVARRQKAVEYVCKPATMAALIGVAVALDARPGAATAWFIAALLFSLAGDVFLMLPHDLFVFGLGSFLVAHLAYIAGLNVDGGSAGALAVSALVVAAVAIVVARPILRAVWRGDDPTLRIPVVVYMLAISAMVTTRGRLGPPAGDHRGRAVLRLGRDHRVEPIRQTRGVDVAVHHRHVPPRPDRPRPVVGAMTVAERWGVDDAEWRGRTPVMPGCRRVTR